MQRDSNQRPAAWLAATLCAVASSAALAAEPTSQSLGIMTFAHSSVVNAPIDQAPAPALQSGFRAYIDPETGALRQATNEELQAQAAQAAQAHASTARFRAAPARTMSLPDGGVGMALDESQLQYSTIRRLADGTLEEDCVTGESAAHAVVHGNAPAASKQGELR